MDALQIYSLFVLALFLDGMYSASKQTEKPLIGLILVAMFAPLFLRVWGVW